MNKQQAKKLFAKYTNNECSPEELQLLDAFLDSYQDKTNEWPEFKVGNKDEFRRKSWSKIESHINANRNIDERRSIPYFKYAVVASILLVVAFTLFLNNQKDIKQAKPVIVNQNTIEPGVNKATLTLEDGSVIELDKGHTYENKNVNSSGEKIVYKVKDKREVKEQYNYLTVPRGGEFHIVLSDGTEVWLNSESRLKYPISFTENEAREVELIYGEAYFDVSASINHNGTEFIVNNQSQKIEVLGTEFNIKANKDERNIYTTLVEGEVKISTLNGEQRLLPNQQSKLDIERKSITIAKVDVIPEISWKNGLFIFKNKPLKEIMKVIERWYDVDIIFVNKDLESVKFRGVIKKQVSIEEILTIMKSSSINSYDINNRTVILR